MRLYERHKNGAVIDMDGEPERVSDILLSWRAYQDSLDNRPRVVGFQGEEKRGDSSADQ